MLDQDIITSSTSSRLQPLLAQYKSAAQLVTQNAYLMFSTKVSPFQEKSTMHMKHLFKDNFMEVVSAFVLKYNGQNKWCTTTICHVEQIDENKFAFVRRLENVMSSQPLYERIVVDRSSKELKGYTFEKKTDEAYSEHFVYAEQADKKSVAYNFYMFRDPGLKRILRYRMFNWGVASL
mmetsp:Transcript_5829/g.6977  ORF Transcript_5829/g.6977 Transcript_5829/m.6977 type:complete len:178 (+) Transcript_5829:89-622(+)|eukprot:CAMPEP_0170465992 /NCGR_PEP_ID=MMETSP0123-20130129/10131_1 /TAXON_ID=182087 /ORGANISM="Favella ehrenbergii, Strain Fehren 1" /LENGTH=177 /DNA_ID=CAMNT_0010732033 /DNA_START=89 /DNA_END=622 /DNA_ORIENTATION=-